nr:cytochrome c peroxidase [Iodidimonas gelatinilytica]
MGRYPRLSRTFRAAFPDDTDPIRIENVQKAIAVFEATLITPNAPFDQYLNGDETALNAQQKAGLQAFMDNGCVACHSGINLGGEQFQPFGVVENPGEDLLPPGDKGRFDVSQLPEDEFVFKVPGLRNIALTPPYFHTGKVWDLKQAVRVMGTAQLGIDLSEDDVENITAFLHSLTGDQPRIVYPVLPPSTAETPRPNP